MIVRVYDPAAFLSHIVIWPSSQAPWIGTYIRRNSAQKSSYDLSNRIFHLNLLGVEYQ